MEIAIEVPDGTLVSSLARWVGRLPETQVQRQAVPPGAGELGAVDILIAIMGSSGVVALIQALPEFLRAKRSPISVKLRHKGREIEVSASKIDDVSAMVDKLLEK